MSVILLGQKSKFGVKLPIKLAFFTLFINPGGDQGCLRPQPSEGFK